MRTSSLAVLLAGSYLAGCVVGAYYIARLRRGTDIRRAGSGNAGALNMARVHGFGDAILTFGFDAGKGVLVAWAGLHVLGATWAGAAAMTAAIIGHIWPAQLGFHGGKGAATGLGGLLLLDAPATVALLAIGAVVFLVTRRFTASGLVAIGLAAPALALRGHDASTVAIAAAASALCVVVHHPAIDARRQPQPPDVRAAEPPARA